MTEEKPKDYPGVVTFRCPECHALRAYNKLALELCRAGKLQQRCRPSCSVVHIIHTDGTIDHV